MWLLSLSWFSKGFLSSFFLSQPFPLIPLHFSFYIFTSIWPVQILPLWEPVHIDWLQGGLIIRASYKDIFHKINATERETKSM